MTKTEMTTRLREMALQVIHAATFVIDAVGRGEPPKGLYDPGPWRIKAAYARKILHAIDGGRRVDS